MPESSPKSAGHGYDYIVLDGQRLDLERHPTDFLVDAGSAIPSSPALTASWMVARGLLRVRTASPGETGGLMEQARAHGFARHVYVNAKTGEELLIGDRIVLELVEDDPARLSEISREFHLAHETRMGAAHILRLGPATGMNPLEVANRIADLPGVRSCHPEILVEQQYHAPQRPAPR
jgi:hypothetical protein